MYNPPYYKESDDSIVFQFIKENPFALLCGTDVEQKPVATQVPVFIDERNGELYLSGHIMRNTDHHKGFLQNENVLVIFTGAHTYISASWYENKQQASTWNYMSVHANGKLAFQDETALFNILHRTTDYFENNPSSGANYKDIPTDYLHKFKNAIVAFEIKVDKLEHVFKLSQNKDEQTYENIIQRLQQKDPNAQAIATEMLKRKSKLFPK